MAMRAVSSSLTTRRDRPTAVLCGSFRREPDSLRIDLQGLEEIADVLSPTSVEFVGDWDGFVYTKPDEGSSPDELERNHLEALRDADFVWLHAPDGYVGPSATLEIGAAQEAGIPIFARTMPKDVTLRLFVRIVADPAAVIQHLVSPADAPVTSLGALQRYYSRVASQRGYDDETIQDAMLLLTEEVGELARAIRKRIDLHRDSGPNLNEAAMELADIQLYVLHLANLLSVNLGVAVLDKERINDVRFRERLASAG